MPPRQTPAQDPRDLLVRVLQREQELEFTNRSVVGGLDRLLERHRVWWDSSFPRLALPAPSYKALDEPQRQQWAQRALQALEGAPAEDNAAASSGAIAPGRVVGNPLDHPSDPLSFGGLRTGSGQEGGGNISGGTPPDPLPFGFAQGRLRGKAPLDSPSQQPASRRVRPRRPPIPPTRPPLTLDSPMPQLSSVTRREAPGLERLGLLSLRDLLYHFPRRYNEIRPVSQLLPLDEEQAAVVTLWEARAVTLGRGGARATEGVVGDETGNLRVLWFNQPYLARRLKPGSLLLLSGRVGDYRGQRTFESPETEVVASADPTLEPGRLLPVYPSTEGLTQRTLRRVAKEALERALPQLQETLPPRLLDSLRLLSLQKALAQAHFPGGQEEVEEARRRLAFEELLVLQLWALGHRQAWRVPGAGIALPSRQVGMEAFLASLPFRLTPAQERALEEIHKDIEQSVPMNRLLHGEVGSGKTVVALAALLTAAANGFQGALMAPTEILAEQHFQTITGLLSGVAMPWQQRFSVTFYLFHHQGLRPDKSGTPSLEPSDPHPQPISVGLLIGSMTPKQKQEIARRLEEGTLDLVVGTHALIQEGVNIPKLALAVVDEQHRFGVMQRAALRQRTSEKRPHLLVMSATPIPRTLALTLYGDLDVSVLDQLPPGRQPLRTRWAKAHQRQAAYDFLRHQVEQGRQAYVVCPLIEESEALQVRAATEEHQRLAQEVYPDLRLGLLHGRMPAREKSRVIEAFRQGEVQVLVSTPVVEVGVDVPNATVMMVEAADRFGLAQLHQLRGRVGRGQHPGYCLLLADDPSPEAQERLTLLEKLHDGFALAEEDLRLRGPGEYTGVRQSGMPDLRMARLSDYDLLTLARQEAAHLLEEDPGLERPEHRLLKETLARLGEQQAGARVGELS